MKTEILWDKASEKNFLPYLKSFIASLDSYQIAFDLEKLDEKKYVQIKNGEYNR